MDQIALKGKEYKKQQRAQRISQITNQQNGPQIDEISPKRSESRSNYNQQNPSKPNCFQSWQSDEEIDQKNRNSMSLGGVRSSPISGSNINKSGKVLVGQFMKPIQVEQTKKSPYEQIKKQSNRHVSKQKNEIPSDTSESLDYEQTKQVTQLKDKLDFLSQTQSLRRINTGSYNINQQVKQNNLTKANSVPKFLVQKIKSNESLIHQIPKPSQQMTFQHRNNKQDLYCGSFDNEQTIEGSQSSSLGTYENVNEMRQRINQLKIKKNDTKHFQKSAQIMQGQMIMGHLNNQMQSLLTNIQENQQNFNIHNTSSSDCSDSISEADEYDAKILSMGFYQDYKFVELDKISSFQREFTQKRHIRMQTFINRNTFSYKCINFLKCRRHKKAERFGSQKTLQADKGDKLSRFLDGSLIMRPAELQKRIQQTGSYKDSGKQQANKIVPANSKNSVLSVGSPTTPVQYLTSYMNQRNTTKNQLQEFETKLKKEQEQCKDRKYMSNAYIEHVIKKQKELSKLEDKEKEQSEESDTLSSGSSMYGDGSQKQLMKKNCCYRYLAPLMIEPDNQRLWYFHILCCYTLHLDFFLTCLLVGNRDFQMGRISDDYLNQKQLYTIIIIIQICDIIANFFSIIIIDVEKVEDPIKIGMMYMGDQFITDVISTVPWTTINRNLVPLRLLKLRRFQTNQKIMDQMIEDSLPNFFNKEQSKIIVDTFKMIVTLYSSMHLFANLWINLGMWGHETQEGWFYKNEQAGVQNGDFYSLYVSSIYWVFTSFSTVGYGDITGVTKLEMLFQIIVMMSGICLFGYMTGIVQAIFDGFKVRDQNEESQEHIDNWLFQIDKSIPNLLLPKAIISKVRDFYIKKFKYDQTIVQNCILFEQMKPRFQKLILDQVQAPLREKFSQVFQDYEIEFQRDIFRKVQFKYISNVDKDDDFYTRMENPLFSKLRKGTNFNMKYTQMFKFQSSENWFLKNNNNVPCILEAQTFSKNVYFILEGSVNVMNKNGQYQYAILEEGSYFGEMSILQRKPSCYSYFYDNYSDKPLILLSIKDQDFVQICRNHPLITEDLMKRGQKKEEMLDNFKKIQLIRYMKYMTNTTYLPDINKELKDKKLSLVRRVLIMKSFKLKLRLTKLLLQQYNLNKVSKHEKEMLRAATEAKIKEQFLSMILKANKDITAKQKSEKDKLMMSKDSSLSKVNSQQIISQPGHSDKQKKEVKLVQFKQESFKDRSIEVNQLDPNYNTQETQMTNQVNTEDNLIRTTEDQTNREDKNWNSDTNNLHDLMIKFPSGSKQKEFQKVNSNSKRQELNYAKDPRRMNIVSFHSSQSNDPQQIQTERQRDKIDQLSIEKINDNISAQPQETNTNKRLKKIKLSSSKLKIIEDIKVRQQNNQIQDTEEQSDDSDSYEQRKYHKEGGTSSNTDNKHLGSFLTVSKKQEYQNLSAENEKEPQQIPEEKSKIRQLLEENMDKYQKQLSNTHKSKQTFLEKFQNTLHNMVGTCKDGEEHAKNKFFHLNNNVALVVGVKNKLEKNQDEIKEVLHEYLNLRQNEHSKKLANAGLREAIQKIFARKKNESYENIQLEKCSSINHVDMILEEYLDLSYFAQSAIEHNYFDNQKGVCERLCKKIVEDSKSKPKKPHGNFKGFDKVLHFMFDKHWDEAVNNQEFHEQRFEQMHITIKSLSQEMTDKQTKMIDEMHEIKDQIKMDKKPSIKKDNYIPDNIQALFEGLNQDNQDEVLNNLLRKIHQKKKKKKLQQMTQQQMRR